MQSERVVGLSSSEVAPLGVFSHLPGAQVMVFEGAGDYLSMRAAQSAALADLMAMEEFEIQSTSTKNNARWLLASLVNEITYLIPVALKEATQGD